MKIYKKIRLESRLVYGLLIVAVFILALMSTFLYKDMSKYQSNLFKTAMEPLLDMKKKEAEYFFLSHSKIATSIIQSEDFDSFIKTGKNKDSLQKLFSFICKANSSINKIRYIDENGDEIIIIERDYNSPQIKIIEDNKLQNKKTSSYFINSSILEPQSIWLSKIELNLKEKEIELPSRPTLKVSTPAWVDSVAKGIVIMDIDLDTFFSQLSIPKIFNLFLFDQDGYYLLHYKREKQYSRYLNNKDNVFNDFNLTRPFLEEIREPQFIENMSFINLFNNSSEKIYAAIQLNKNHIALSDKDMIFIIVKNLALLIFWMFLIWYVISQMMKDVYDGLTTKIKEKDIAEDKLSLINIELESRVEERTKKLTASLETIHHVKSLLKISNNENKTLLMQQDFFIKKMMHEIGTPVSIIVLNTDLLYRKFGEDKHLNMIKASSKILTTIYNDIAYTISKKSNNHEAQMNDLCKFIHDRVSYFHELLKVKSIDCEVECSEVSMVWINSIELQRLLDNTISNAIKYSHENGKIVVRLETKRDTISLSIEDFGIGIKNVETIFTNFYRDDNIHIGLGIGLSIVNDICKSNDIKIEVNSILNKGTLFTYTFNRPLNISKDSGEEI